MTWNEYLADRGIATVDGSIESQVLAKLGGRLEEFSLDEIGGQLVLRGRAQSRTIFPTAAHSAAAFRRSLASAITRMIGSVLLARTCTHASGQSTRTPSESSTEPSRNSLFTDWRMAESFSG
jgi:hypothetical protein